MFDRDHIYGFDIETDNSNGHGLNPQLAAITQISLVTETDTLVFDGDELAVLRGFAAAVTALEPGLLVGWNSMFFDLPFIVDRSRAYESDGRLDGAQGFILTPQPGLKPKYEPLPGHTGGYSATWVRTLGDGNVASPYAVGEPHQHLDVSLAYRKHAETAGVKWSLKPVCASLGIDMVELDRERLHTYTAEQVNAYCASDSAGTRELALRLLGLA